MRKAIIMGAGGRDFHNFNVFFRNDPEYKVVAFTAAQIPFIENRTYPSHLAGESYPNGIPIYPEKELQKLIKEQEVDDVFFSYSDVSYEYLMHIASIVLANGASFHLLGAKDTMLKSRNFVISVLAVRTGAGKSTIAKKVVGILLKMNLKAVVVRHPMAYGDLSEPVQRFESKDDLDKYETTIEEREEFEAYTGKGVIVFAGVDYRKVLEEAEKEGEIIVWDGGNNDLPFYKPDFNIVVVDPLRAGHETRYHPGEACLRMADLVIVNKVNAADPKKVEEVIKVARELNPDSKIIHMKSEVLLDRPELVKGKRVLVIEDGPSLTHGELREGAGAFIAKGLGANLIDPRPYAIGSYKEIFDKYQIGSVLPALGYNKTQLDELEHIVNSINCDAIVLGTPADLTRLIKINKPVARVRLEAVDVEKPGLEDMLIERLKDFKKD